ADRRAAGGVCQPGHLRRAGAAPLRLPATAGGRLAVGDRLERRTGLGNHGAVAYPAPPCLPHRVPSRELPDLHLRRGRSGGVCPLRSWPTGVRLTLRARTPTSWPWPCRQTTPRPMSSCRLVNGGCPLEHSSVVGDRPEIRGGWRGITS